MASNIEVATRKDSNDVVFSWEEIFIVPAFLDIWLLHKIQVAVDTLC